MIERALFSNMEIPQEETEKKEKRNS